LRARVLCLDEIAGQPVGGKASGLARLRAMGLRVPETLVLVGAEPGPLSPEIEARIEQLGDRPLAVRSSAIGEDGHDASFAGQYETVLDVRGRDELRAAIERCLVSASNERASAYREAREASGLHAADAAPVMSIVVQQMVDARVSGVCFTVDPVTQRRNRLVIDSVAGLGEALVSGHASPDHDELLREQMRWEPRVVTGEGPVLSEGERARVAAEAAEAEKQAGEPLDLEWAIDASGELFWLQARPITTLRMDPQSLDTGLLDSRDVFTRCNVGEMMPGAVSPLTFSTCARGIDVGWQMNMIDLGVRARRDPENVYIGMSHGHLFINLSEGARFAAAVTGSSPDEQSLAICGRLVPEVVAPEVPPLRVRLPRIVRQVWSVLRAQPNLRKMERLEAGGAMATAATAFESWQNIDAKMEGLFESYARHLTVSSGAGALAPILLRVLAGDGEPSDQHHAIVANLFAGADGVESADIAEGAERVLDALLQCDPLPEGFAELEVDAAFAWLGSAAAGEPGRLLAAYLRRHGHRSLRELDIRQPEWEYDPTPLVRSLQTQVRGRLRQLENGSGSTISPDARLAASRTRAEPTRFRWLARVAHAAVRNRETGKSLLVKMTRHFKRAYRGLGVQLVSEGRLPDADAVYFLLHEELGELASTDAPDRLAQIALERREALAYQQTLVFPEVAVGRPEPERPATESNDDDRIIGKPVSGGVVVGRVRVVRHLEEAESLEPGEILVSPITDVGWTPYFAIIAGLVTDVGSAVSHGAVVAREYGLPAVLNTRDGTRRLKTGDRVRLDGDRGVVDRLETETRFERALAAIDEANALDPNRLDFDGESVPKELLHGRRATHWVRELEAEPSEELLLASRAHHLRRWQWPRAEFPEGRAGYHAWRRELQARHAAGASEILERCGYDAADRERVGELIRKKGLGRDPEVQTLEDALCLVFIESQLSSFSTQHSEEKVVDIIARSLAKMSERGRSAAGGISLGVDEAALVSAAVSKFEQDVSSRSGGEAS
jgi:phosphohistidine swiveling domain-containing protein